MANFYTPSFSYLPRDMSLRAEQFAPDTQSDFTSVDNRPEWQRPTEQQSPAYLALNLQRQAQINQWNQRAENPEVSTAQIASNLAQNPINTDTSSYDLARRQAARSAGIPGAVDILMEHNRDQKGFTKSIDSAEDLHNNKAWNLLFLKNPEHAKQVYQALGVGSGDFVADVKATAKNKADLFAFPRETLQSWLKEGRIRQDAEGNWQEKTKISPPKGSTTSLTESQIEAWVPASGITQSIIKKAGGLPGLGLPPSLRSADKMHILVEQGMDAKEAAALIQGELATKIAHERLGTKEYLKSDEGVPPYQPPVEVKSNYFNPVLGF